MQPTSLYLCASTGTLQHAAVATGSKAQYLSTSRSGRAAFSYKFEQAVELIGSMRLKLWVSTSEGDDLDLFVVVQKIDSTGNEIFFSGFNGYERDGVAKGWLRASHRELDPWRSTPLRPWHKHTQIEKLHSGEILRVEIEIWPSAALFEAESTLQLTILGHDAAEYPAFGHRKLVNRGWHTILTGEPYDSCLAVPLNNPNSE